MKKLFLLYLLFLSIGCRWLPTSTPALPPMEIRTVWGDHLPEAIPDYPAVDLSQRLPWQEIDAVLISKDFLYQAKEDEQLKQKLRGIYYQSILLIYRATTSDVVKILELERAATGGTSSPIIFVAAKMAGPSSVVGMFTSDNEPMTESDFRRIIDEYVRSFKTITPEGIDD